MALQRFGLVSPTLGIGDSIPNVLLEESYSPDFTDTQNVQVRHGEIQSCKMRLEGLWTDDATPAHEQTPDGNPILKYHRFIKRSTGAEYLFAFTKSNIYKWDGTGKEWVDWSDLSVTTSTTTASTTTGSTTTGSTTTAAPPSLSEATHWSVVTFGDSIYATNQVNGMLYGSDSSKFSYMDGTSNGSTGVLIADGSVVTKCNHFIAFENYLWMFATTEDGVYYPHRCRWSDLLNADVTGDYTTCGWSSGDADALDLEGEDHIQAVGLYKTYLIVFKNWSIHQIYLSSGDFIFNVATMSREIGCIAPDSVVNGKYGELYYFASDKTFREIQMGEISLPIDKTLKQLRDTYIPNIRSFLVDEYSEIWWAVTYAGTTNDRVLTYHPEKKIWGHRNIPVSAFGQYAITAVNYTWNTMPGTKSDGTGGESWDEEGMSWDSNKAFTDYVYDLCGDYSGYTWKAHENELEDAGAATTYKFVCITNLSQNADLMNYKRITAMNVYVRYSSNSNSLTFTMKRDNEANWQAITAHPDATSGTIPLGWDNSAEIKSFRLPCDFLGRNFKLKGESTTPFQFIGVIFEFVPLGVR